MRTAQTVHRYAVPFLARHLLDPLASRVLMGEFKSGDRIKVTADDGELTLKKE